MSFLTVPKPQLQDRACSRCGERELYNVGLAEVRAAIREGRNLCEDCAEVSR